MIDTKREASEQQTSKTDPAVKLPPPNPPGGHDDKGHMSPPREEPSKSGAARPADPKVPTPSVPDHGFGR